MRERLLLRCRESNATLTVTKSDEDVLLCWQQNRVSGTFVLQSDKIAELISCLSAPAGCHELLQVEHDNLTFGFYKKPYSPGYLFSLSRNEVLAAPDQYFTVLLSSRELGSLTLFLMPEPPTTKLEPLTGPVFGL